MKILYLTQYFITPALAGGSRHYYHVKHLVECGHKVDVITASVQDHMTRTIPAQYRQKLFIKEWYEGIPVYRTYATANYGKGFFDRIKNYLSFMFFAIITGLKIRGRYDVVFASSPSLFVGLAGYILSRFKRSRFVLEVRDLWPQSAVVLGFLRNRLLIRCAEWLERFLYLKANAIVAVTEGIKNTIMGITPNPQKVSLVTNGVDTDLLESWSEPGFPGEMGDGHKFVAIYVGSHGVNNDLETIITAAAALKNHTEIQFVFVGGGDHKPELKKMCADLALSNVRFSPPQPKHTVFRLLKSADVCLLAIKKGEFFRGTLPNKLFDYLACGKPVVAAVPLEGESAGLIQRLNAGVVCAPEDGMQMADVILTLYQDQAIYDSLVEKGISYVCRYFSRRRLATELERILKSVTEH